VTAGLFAGALAGGIAGGLGGRLAMRVTALMATDAEQGTLTEAEEVVGDVSVGGSVALVFFGGILIGLLGGLIYAVVARWFADAGRWRGLTFGVYLCLALGWTVIEGDNFDFSTLGSVWVNVLMFAGVFVLFGVVIAPVYSWLGRHLPRFIASLEGVAAAILYAFALLLLQGTVLLMLVGIPAGEDGVEMPFYAIIPLFLIVGALMVIGLAVHGGQRFSRLSDLDGGLRNAAIGVVGVPLAVGLVLGAQSIVEMVGEAY
jgi:hypothetical protein